MHPARGDANTVDLARAMAALAGAPVACDTASQTIAGLVGAHEHYVFVLVDGLGMSLLELLPEDSFLRSRVSMMLRAVFPSSTAPALTSIATGRWPAEHAVTGWWVYLPRPGITATILPFIERYSETPIDPASVSPSYAFPAPALPRDFDRDSLMYTPREIAGSLYSRYSSGEAEFFGYRKLAPAVDRIVERESVKTTPSYSYLYISAVDTAAHKHGPNARQPMKKLLAVQQQLERLADGLAGRARIVVTADHGQMTIAGQHVLTAADPLVAMLLVPPTGDGRAPLFHVRPGMHDAFATEFRARYSDDFALLTVDEVDALQLMGPSPLSDETRRRVGDFAGIAMTHAVLLYDPSDDLRALRGHHGGLSPDELRIPLILA